MTRKNDFKAPPTKVF